MVELINNKGKQWQSFNNGFVKGFAFDGDLFLEKESFYNVLLEAVKTNSLPSLLYRLNGNFSAVIYFERKYFLIVDKIRSYPLFYSCHTNIYISDVGHKLLDYVPCYLNEINTYELLALGYLSGNTTLIENIESVVAGSYVIINLENNAYDQYRYYSHIYNKIERSKEALFEIANEKIEMAFSRILNSLKKDQPILLPLSGGYDSRLIACLCKKYELKNVTCFTYGRVDSFEVSISKEIALRLNYKWYFVEYSEEMWTSFLLGKDFQSYCEFAGNLTANPHFQDLPALLELKKIGVITQGMVVIPGHSGDLLGGSKIPIQILENHMNEFTLDTLSHVIYNNLFDLNVLTKEYRNQIIAKLKNELEEFDLNNFSDFLDYYEGYWFVKAKVANFLVNSMRGYEYIGLDWRLPLWDDEYAKVWYETNWKNKFYSLTYNEFMFREYFVPFNVDIYKHKTVFNTTLGLYIKRLFPSILSTFYRRIVSRLRNRKIQKHFDAFDCVSRLLMKSNNMNQYKGISCINLNNMNAVVSEYYLKCLKNRGVLK